MDDMENRHNVEYAGFLSEFEMEWDLVKMEEVEKMAREKINYSMLKTEKKNHHLQTRVDYLQYENSRLNRLLACHGISSSAKSSPQIRLRRKNSTWTTSIWNYMAKLKNPYDQESNPLQNHNVVRKKSAQ
uniref:Uncharacterized protein n=1 Tax=Acrobeloides nanus TaxID=290746 RepID=A0A914DBE9_9BILA